MGHVGFLGRPAWCRASSLLAAAIGLAACVADPGAGGYNRTAGGATLPSRLVPLPGDAAPSRRAAILVPLTGATAEAGQALLRAAQLSFDQPGGIALDVRDTGGTPGGAADAARAALAGGATLLLGPLTAGETGAVAPVAKAAGVPVLAFTSDVAQAQPGVWTLGITPQQQAHRLVMAVQAEGKTRLAAVVPENPFGDALGNGFAAAAAEAGLPPPRLLRYPPRFAGLNASLKEVADYAARHPDAARDKPASGSPTDAPPAAMPSAAPPPIDALLLGAAGDQLAQAAPLLRFYDIGPDQVRILGSALWAREAPRLGALSGAWYAAPDPALRMPFEQQYKAKYGSPPRDLASLAYDAAGLARAVGNDPGGAEGALTRPEGFAGADGLLALQPNGQVRRGLAIFEIDKAGAHIVQPAPPSLSAPGS